MIYLVSVFIFALGLYMVIVEDNYLRKIVGLSIFQTATIIFFVALSKVANGIVPFDKCKGALPCNVVYTSSLTHVLMLTAIVVGFATLSVALALLYRVKSDFGTISESDINQ